ncbi:MAG: alpha/beta fold hydrolase [Acidobacteriota bacterium]
MDVHVSDSPPVASDRLVTRLEVADGEHLEVELHRPPVETATTALLYLHGFASSRAGVKGDLFRELALAAGWAFCSFDFRGHGGSDGTLFDIGLTRNLADLERVDAWLETNGIERLILVGSSMGGGCGLWFAARQPERVVAAAHVAPALALADGLLSRVGAERAAAWERDGRTLMDHELGATELSWDVIVDLRSYRLEELEAATRTPTLIVQGMQDTSVDWRLSIGFAERCARPVVTVHLMADADHRLLDRLESVREMAAIFWRRLGILPLATEGDPAAPADV